MPHTATRPHTASASDSAASPDELLTTAEVALRLRLKQKTVEQWRSNSARLQPLPFVRVGGAVRYRTADLVAFINQGARAQTGV